MTAQAWALRALIRAALQGDDTPEREPARLELRGWAASRGIEDIAALSVFLDPPVGHFADTYNVETRRSRRAA